MKESKFTPKIFKKGKMGKGRNYTIFHVGKGEYNVCFDPPLKPNTKIIISAENKNE